MFILHPMIYRLVCHVIILATLAAPAGCKTTPPSGKGNQPPPQASEPQGSDRAPYQLGLVVPPGIDPLAYYLFVASFNSHHRQQLILTLKRGGSQNQVDVTSRNVEEGSRSSQDPGPPSARSGATPLPETLLSHIIDVAARVAEIQTGWPVTFAASILGALYHHSTGRIKPEQTAEFIKKELLKVCGNGASATCSATTLQLLANQGIPLPGEVRLAINLTYDKIFKTFAPRAKHWQLIITTELMVIAAYAVVMATIANQLNLTNQPLGPSILAMETAPNPVAGHDFVIRTANGKIAVQTIDGNQIIIP